MTKYYELGYKIQLINYKNAPEKDINEILCNYINKNKENDITPNSKADDIQNSKDIAKNSNAEDIQNSIDIPADYMTEDDYEVEEEPPIASSAQYSFDYIGRY